MTPRIFLLLTAIQLNAQLPITGKMVFDIKTPTGAIAFFQVTMQIEDKTGAITYVPMKNPGQFIVEDLPFGEHTVIVNRGRCNETRLVGLRYEFGIQQSYKIVLNGCPLGHDTRGGNACSMELRVRDGEKGPAKGATVNYKGKVMPVDDYGRLFTLVRPGKHLLKIEHASRVQETEVECRLHDAVQHVVTF